MVVPLWPFSWGPIMALLNKDFEIGILGAPNIESQVDHCPISTHEKHFIKPTRCKYAGAILHALAFSLLLNPHLNFLGLVRKPNGSPMAREYCKDTNDISKLSTMCCRTHLHCLTLLLYFPVRIHITTTYLTT